MKTVIKRNGSSFYMLELKESMESYVVTFLHMICGVIHSYSSRSYGSLDDAKEAFGDIEKYYGLR